VLSQYRNDEKNQYDKKSNVVTKLEKGEQIVDTCCNVRFPHISISTGCNNAVRITDSYKSGIKLFGLQKVFHSLDGTEDTTSYGGYSLMFYYCIINK
jgi:hypothetical protein